MEFHENVERLDFDTYAKVAPGGPEGPLGAGRAAFQSDVAPGGTSHRPIRHQARLESVEHVEDPPVAVPPAHPSADRSSEHHPREQRRRVRRAEEVSGDYGNDGAGHRAEHDAEARFESADSEATSLEGLRLHCGAFCRRYKANAIGRSATASRGRRTRFDVLQDGRRS